MSTPSHVRQIFANLPVADLARAKAFYTALGFTVNEQFTNEAAACIVVSDTIHVMLLTHGFFQGFTDRPIADGQSTTQMLLALSCADRADVDRFADTALAHGGRSPRPTQDLGFMYSRAVADPDGHIWEPFHMAAMPPAA